MFLSLIFQFGIEEYLKLPWNTPTLSTIAPFFQTFSSKFLCFAVSNNSLHYLFKFQPQRLSTYISSLMLVYYYTKFSVPKDLIQVSVMFFIDSFFSIQIRSSLRSANDDSIIFIESIATYKYVFLKNCLHSQPIH